MVLGLRSKHTRDASLRFGYIVHIKEIRPWPPHPSLGSVQTVWLQWEHGNHLSGSFVSAAQHSQILFNQSFNLSALLYRDKKDHHKFRKNTLEFSLFAPRKDNPKGRLLGTATINFADHGVIESTVSIDAPLHFKKGSNNSVQSYLLIRLEPDEKGCSSTSSPNVNLSKEPSLDNDTDHSEIASFTDDDTSSHSSRTGQLSTSEAVAASPSQIDKIGYNNLGHDPEQNRNVLPSSSDAYLLYTGNHISENVSLPKLYGRSMTSVEKSSEAPTIRPASSSVTANRVGSHVSVPKFDRRSVTFAKNSETSVLRSSDSSINQDAYWQPQPNNGAAHSVQKHVSFSTHKTMATNEHKTYPTAQQSADQKLVQGFELESRTANNYVKDVSISPNSQEKDLQPPDAEIPETRVALVNIVEKMEIKDGGADDKIIKGMNHFLKSKSIGKSCEDTEEQGTLMRDEKPLVPSSIAKAGSQHAKSVQKHSLVEEAGPPSEIYMGNTTPDPYTSVSDSSQEDCIIERNEPKYGPSGCNSEWKTRIETLEDELRESAAIEVGLYSVVAEHTSSGNKVHAPARRLSRFYSNTCKAGSQAKRSSAARAAISGLVVVSKSCGNDVARLTFWLSNAIMLRSIISQTAAEFPCSNGMQNKTKVTEPVLNGIPSDKWADSTCMRAEESPSNEEPDDWEDVSSFIIALEKVESWIFSRIVESLWWQSFTPHMQPTVTKGSGLISGLGTNKNNFGRRNSLGNQEQGSFSTELWKKAFKDACERLCPNRAAGHECGCLSALVRLVMEQLVNRLDVAMFNAILRESADEMPTDPLSDPICEPKVLPIPTGKSSFGAGVELKNAIGSWSRWLTDLFDLEDEPMECSDIHGDGRRPKYFKAFRLLHELSDLMMLPFEMLAGASERKEVCPMFGPTIIKRVLTNFVPDEFSPEPVPQNIIDALGTEEVSDDSGGVLTSLPCTASPTEYSPPPAALLMCVGEVGKQVLRSSRLPSVKKSYTSDDELDQLDSPFTSIVPDSFESSALAKLGLMRSEKSKKSVARYQLLREMWKDEYGH